MQAVKSQPTFQRNMSPPSSGLKSMPGKKPPRSRQQAKPSACYLLHSGSSDTSVDFQRTTRRCMPEDRILHNHRSENLKSDIRNTRTHRSLCEFCTVYSLLSATRQTVRKETGEKRNFIVDGDSSRGSVVGIATGYGLDDRGVGVRVPVRPEFSLLHVVQTGSGAHPTSYPIGTGGSFPGGKVAGT
jgi:hypothetical protein